MSVLFVVGETRFRAPTDPFVVLLAALAVAALIGRVGRPGTQKTT